MYHAVTSSFQLTLWSKNCSALGRVWNHIYTLTTPLSDTHRGPYTHPLLGKWFYHILNPIAKLWPLSSLRRHHKLRRWRIRASETVYRRGKMFCVHTRWRLPTSQDLECWWQSSLTSWARCRWVPPPIPFWASVIMQNIKKAQVHNHGQQRATEVISCSSFPDTKALSLHSSTGCSLVPRVRGFTRTPFPP